MVTEEVARLMVVELWFSIALKSALLVAVAVFVGLSLWYWRRLVRTADELDAELDRVRREFRRFP